MEEGPELVSDFQRYFNTNLYEKIEEIFAPETPSRRSWITLSFVADLFSTLPREGLFATKNNPDLTVGYTENLFRQIDHKLGILVWRETKDAKKRRNAPEAFPLPSEWVRRAEKEEKKAVYRSKEAEQAAIDLISGKGLNITSRTSIKEEKK